MPNDKDQDDQNDTFTEEPLTLEELTESDAFSATATVHDPIDAGVATVDDDGKIDVGADHAGRRVGYVIEEHEGDWGADE